MESNGKSSYNALQLIFERRFSSGLTISGNYTLAHALANVAGSGGACTTCAIVLNNLEYDYGNSDYDVKHRVAVTVDYQIPFGKSLKGAEAQVLRGWEVNGLYSFESGLPFTVTDSLDTQDTPGLNQGNERPNALALQPFTQSLNEWFNISDFAMQTAGTAGNEGRNQFFSPAAKRLDFSVFKNFPLREAMSLQFRTEIFNLTNTPSFAPPGTAISSFSGGVPASAGNFGRITTTNAFYTPRDIQFALKLLSRSCCTT